MGSLWLCLCLPFPHAVVRPGVPVLCWGHPGEVFSGEEGDVGSVPRVDGSKGSCGLPRDPVPLHLGVPPQAWVRVSPPSTPGAAERPFFFLFRVVLLFFFSRCLPCLSLLPPALRLGLTERRLPSLLGKDVPLPMLGLVAAGVTRAGGGVLWCPPGCDGTQPCPSPRAPCLVGLAASRSTLRAGVPTEIPALNYWA